MSLPELITFEKRQEAVRIARDFLAGRIRLIKAAEQLALLWRRVGVDQTDSDFLTFVFIHDGATAPRRGCTAASEAEVASFEAKHRDEAIEAASSLVDRFGDEKTPQSDWV